MPTLAALYKRSGLYVPSPCPETTILVCPDGKLRTFSFPYYQQQARVLVRDFATGAEVASANWPAAGTAGGTAIVANGAVHVFAAVPFVGAANSIVHAVFDTSWALSSPQAVYTATAPDNVCNLGITASPFGYIMSVETQQPTRQMFFLRSTDLNTWTPIGTPWATGAYLGSPKIYWSQRRGCFFVTFLVSEGGKFFTRVAMLPADLSSRQVASQALVFPDGAGETVNTSDLTIAEQNGITHIVYLDGDQSSYANYRAAVFLGSMEALWEQFFPFTASAPPPPPPPGGNTNLLPQMTGQTTAGVTITASDTHPSNFHPWLGGDRNAGTFWHCDPSVPYPHKWFCDFPAAQTVYSYSIRARAGFVGQGPKNLSLRDKNTGVIFDTRTNVSYTEGVANIFTLAAPATATDFEIVMDSNVEGTANLSFAEVELRG